MPSQTQADCVKFQQQNSVGNPVSGDTPYKVEMMQDLELYYTM